MVQLPAALLLVTTDQSYHPPSTPQQEGRRLGQGARGQTVEDRNHEAAIYPTMSFYTLATRAQHLLLRHGVNIARGWSLDDVEPSGEPSRKSHMENEERIVRTETAETLVTGSGDQRERPTTRRRGVFPRPQPTERLATVCIPSRADGNNRRLGLGLLFNKSSECTSGPVTATVAPHGKSLSKSSPGGEVGRVDKRLTRKGKRCRRGGCFALQGGRDGENLPTAHDELTLIWVSMSSS